MFGVYLSLPAFTANAGDANKIYKDTCELCHAADGKGSEAGKQFGVPDFSSTDYQKSRTDAQMKESMTNGTKNPNYVKLSDLGVDPADLDALIKIVRGFAK
jgi:mono/diheme cytochrome c family protein